jgi:hypothetical protein
MLIWLSRTWNVVCVDVFVENSPDARALSLHLLGDLVTGASLEEKTDNVFFRGRHHYERKGRGISKRGDD